VVHIESRKSEKNDSMFDIYVDLETDYIRLQELIKRLKKQVASITLNDFPIPQSPALTPGRSFHDIAPQNMTLCQNSC
jgi:hypothetical protein